MERYITNLSSLQSTDLNNYDWDIIELDISINNQEMLNWYHFINSNYFDLCFMINQLHLIKPDLRVKISEFAEQNLWGIGKQWTLQWPVERNVPIPFRYVADPDQYPELLDQNFDEKFNSPIKKYFFGEFQNLYDRLGSDVWEVSRLVQLDKNTGLKPHTDTNSGFLPRLHYQIQYTQDAWWEFYDDRDSDPRARYYLEQGKLYIMNTAVIHAAKNEGEIPWVMLHSNPTPAAIDRLLELSIDA